MRPFSDLWKVVEREAAGAGRLDGFCPERQKARVFAKRLLVSGKSAASGGHFSI